VVVALLVAHLKLGTVRTGGVEPLFVTGNLGDSEVVSSNQAEEVNGYNTTTRNRSHVKSPFAALALDTQQNIFSTVPNQKRFGRCTKTWMKAK